MTGMDLGMNSGLSMNYVRNIERGLRRITWDAALRLADTMGLTIEERKEWFGIIAEETIPHGVLICIAPWRKQN